MVSPNQLDRKGNNTVRKCKLNKYLFENKTKESVMPFATRGLLVRTITNSRLVAYPIKMQDLH